MLDRIERVAEQDLRAYRVRVLAALRSAIGFDAYAWLLTDPVSCVGAAPVAEVPVLADLPRLIRLKYLTTVNRWTALPSSRVASLAGDPSRSLLWRELLHGYGVVDVASMVFRDAHGCWGWLDLWRTAGDPFSPAELRLLAGLLPELTSAQRTRLAATFREPAAAFREPDAGPVVMLLSADLELIAQTPGTDAYLRSLLPTTGGASPVPAAAYNVGAQLLAGEENVDGHPPTARVHLDAGRWLTLRAARLPDRTIAVTIENTGAADRAALFAAASGLSGRESELLGLLLTGADTRRLAASMVLSEHTVQDHLKSIFAKTGAGNRRALVARALGT